MERSAVKHQVIDVLQKYTLDKSVWDNVSEEAEFSKDLKIKSARFVDAVLDLEDLFDITIVEYEVFSIGELVDGIMEQLAKK